MSTDLLERPDTTAPPASGLCWTTIAGLSLIHLAGIAGLVWIVVNPSLPTLVLTAVLYVACGLGITAGYHRLFAHRTYSPVAPVRWALLAFGAATFQNSALSWSADHRAHHADTDGAGDPHAVTRGAWFAHLGWLFRRREASADVTRLTDLGAVTSIRLQHRFYVVIAVGVGLVLPTVIAAQWGDPWGGLLVGGFLRTAVMLQATFCVNSLAHLIGKRRYDRALVGSRQRRHSVDHIRRGLPQLPPPVPVRLSKRPEVVAIRPRQMAHLDARPSPPRRSAADGVSGEQSESCCVGERLTDLDPTVSPSRAGRGALPSCARTPRSRSPRWRTARGLVRADR